LGYGRPAKQTCHTPEFLFAAQPAEVRGRASHVSDFERSLTLNSGVSQSLKALQNWHLTPAQGQEKKKILGCWWVALPPANTPNPDFEKTMTLNSRKLDQRSFLD
jgi:hypothetical protein